MLKTTIFHGLEKIINLLLSRDMDSIARLAKLEDKLVVLEFTDLNLKFYWLFENHCVRILSTSRDAVDASIAGPLTAIARLGLSKAKVAKELTISGDMHVVEAFKELFAKLDIDWEAELATVTGDVIAFKIGKLVRVASRWAKQAADSMHENTKEYLAEESQLLPPRMLFADFVADVRQLSRDVDRLAARIKRLQMRAGS